MAESLQLIFECSEDIGTPAWGAETNFPSASRGDDESGRLVVEGEGISVWTDGFGRCGVEVWLAYFGVVERTCTAVFCGVGFGAGGEAGVEYRALDVVVWVWVDTVTWLGGLLFLEVPRTPVCYHGIGLFAFIWKRER